MRTFPPAFLFLPLFVFLVRITAPFHVHPNFHRQALSHLAFHSSPVKLRLATLFTPPPTIAIVGVEWAEDVQLFARHAFHVYAVEPVSKFLAHLDKLLQHNPHWNVTVAPFAASSHSTGLIHLHYDNENVSERVAMRRLDDLVHESLAVLSIDVQGDEYHVVQGASRLLRSHVINSLWIEAIACNDRVPPLLHLLQDDYELFDFVPWGKLKGDTHAVPKSRGSFAFEPRRPSDVHEYLHWMCELKKSRYQWLQTDFVAVRKQLVDEQVLKSIDSIASMACGEEGDCVLRNLILSESNRDEL